MCLTWAQVSPRSMQQTCRSCLHLPYTIQSNKEAQCFLQSSLLTEHGHLLIRSLASMVPHSVTAQRQKFTQKDSVERKQVSFPSVTETYLLPHWYWRKHSLIFSGSRCSTLHWIIKEWLSQKEGVVQGKRLFLRQKLKMLKRWGGLQNTSTPVSAASTILEL